MFSISKWYANIFEGDAHLLAVDLEPEKGDVQYSVFESVSLTRGTDVFEGDAHLLAVDLGFERKYVQGFYVKMGSFSTLDNLPGGALPT